MFDVKNVRLLAISNFVLVFFLNKPGEDWLKHSIVYPFFFQSVLRSSLIRYASVIAYMKF